MFEPCLLHGDLDERSSWLLGDGPINDFLPLSTVSFLLKTLHLYITFYNLLVCITWSGPHIYHVMSSIRGFLKQFKENEQYFYFLWIKKNLNVIFSFPWTF